jgi:phage tail-like protein
MEETIANLAVLFDPQQTREDFLPWLAAWTAFTLRADLNVVQQRDFIANIVQRYQRRGTKQNLQELLAIFNVGTPTIIEAGTEFQIGVHSTIGQDIYLGGGPPHYFHVTISLSQEFQGKPEALERQRDIARALIELEKPAHTFYDLAVIFPSMQIGVHSTVGVDTLLGTLPST